MRSRRPVPAYLPLATCCPWSTSRGHCVMVRSPAQIHGMRPDWNGKPHHRRLHSILTRLLSSPGKRTTTTRLNRSSKMEVPLSDSHATAVDTAESHPQLRHHFANMEQQKNTASLGMWLFLVTEIMFFGGLFCAYLIYRLMHFNAFAAASQQLDIKWGAFQHPVLMINRVTAYLAE